MSLGHMAMKGSLWSFLAAGGQQALQFGFFVFLARVLEPSAFGLIAMAAVMIDLLYMAGRVGMTEVLVQRPTQNDVVMNKVFWFLQGLGLVLVIAVIMAAGPVAQWYSAPELKDVIVWLAPTILLQNMSIVHEARLRRKFGFKSLASRTLGGTLGGGLVGVIFAACGFGVYSLVIQRISSVILQVGLLWSADAWRPTLKLKDPDAEPLLPLLRNGVDVMFTQIVGALNARMVDVMIGFFMGPVILGYLRIAWRTYDFVLQLTLQPISNVAQSLMSRLQGDRPKLIKTYKRMVELAALGVMPVLLGLASVAPLAIQLCFGSKWLPAAPLMQIMWPIAFATTINVFFSPVMIATGNSRWLPWQGIFQVVLSASMTYVGAQFGLMAVIGINTFRTLLVSSLNVYLMKRLPGIPVKLTLLALTPPAVAGLTMGLVVTLVRTSGWLSHLPMWLELGVLMALGAAIYGGVLILCFRAHVAELMKDLRMIMTRRVDSSVLDTHTTAV